MITRFMNSAETCIICYEDIQLQGKLDCCKHIFCVKCIKKWSEVRCNQTENSCPICKSRFFSITQVPRRKYYKVSVRKMKKVVKVGKKDQNSSIDFLTLLQAAERILTHELHQLFENS